MTATAGSRLPRTMGAVIEELQALRDANTELRAALKTVIVLASDNPDMLVMHILASDSPIRRVWDRRGESSENDQVL